MEQDLFYKNLLDNLYDGVYFVDCDRKITYWNRGAERITGYQAAEVVGKHCHENILIHINEQGENLCTTSCPLTAAITSREQIESEAFLHHKDGHRIPVLIRTSPITNAAGGVIGAVEVFSDNSSKAMFLHCIEELQKISIADHLTGLANRRYIEMVLEARLSEMQRYGWPFGVLFIDIDHFKQINDAYGHDTGDEVLKMVAQTFIHNARPFDTVGRWGGEEFVAVILNVSKDLLYTIANRLRILIEKSLLSVDSRTIGVTISIGATLVEESDTIDSLLKRADSLMYQSKLSGRNCVTLGSGS